MTKRNLKQGGAQNKRICTMPDAAVVVRDPHIHFFYQNILNFILYRAEDDKPPDRAQEPLQHDFVHAILF